MAMKRSRICCWVSVDNAVLFVALVEVILGAAFFTLIFFVIKEICYGHETTKGCVDLISAVQGLEETEGRPDSPDKDNEIPQVFEVVNNNVRPVLYWFLMKCLVCFGITCGMAVFLAIAAKMKNRPMCIIWLIVTAVTCIFSGFVIRILGMLIVHELYRELAIEQRLTNLSGALANPKRDLESFEVTRKAQTQLCSFPADIQC